MWSFGPLQVRLKRDGGLRPFKASGPLQASSSQDEEPYEENLFLHDWVDSGLLLQCPECPLQFHAPLLGLCMICSVC